MPKQGKVRKLKAIVTRPLVDDSRLYWHCPFRGCQHYQHVLVGTSPTSLDASMQCPTCKGKYRVRCLYQDGGDIFVMAELGPKPKVTSELLDTGGTNDRGNSGPGLP